MELDERKAIFGEKLLLYRGLRGLSREKLSQLSGISVSSLTTYEHGRGNPTLEAISQLAAALSVSPGQLLEEDPAALRESWSLQCIDQMLRVYANSGSAQEFQRRLAGYTEFLLLSLYLLAGQPPGPPVPPPPQRR